jgi:NhaP-type Na+/H+ or K+/H+ antiporter
LLLTFGFASYFLSESLELSGVISLLCCGITMGHYSWYNLSPQGQSVSSVTFSILGSAAESISFLYIGLSAFTFKGPYCTLPLSLIAFFAIITILGRFLSVFLIEAIFRGSKTRLLLKEIFFISFGGIIKGAISFALVLKFTDQNNLLIITILSIVIFTSVILGSLMPLIQYFLFSKDS